MTNVEVERGDECERVEGEQTHAQIERAEFARALERPVNGDGDEHVARAGRDEHDKREHVHEEDLDRADEREHDESGEFDEMEEESETCEERTGGDASVVGSVVDEGDGVAEERVEADAETPECVLRVEMRYACAHGWKHVGYVAVRVVGSFEVFQHGQHHAEDERAEREDETEVA